MAIKQNLFIYIKTDGCLNQKIPLLFTFVTYISPSEPLGQRSLVSVCRVALIVGTFYIVILYAHLI